MRFIHASDLHLGMIPDGQKSWGRERSNALLSSLDKIVDLALKENVDALFLLGQSFHFSPLKDPTESLSDSFLSCLLLFQAGSLLPFSEFCDFPAKCTYPERRTGTTLY